MTARHPPLPQSRSSTMTLIVLSVASLLLAACATNSPAPVSGASTAREDSTGKARQLSFKLASGVYRCELGQQIEVQRDPRNVNEIGLRWQGGRHTLRRYDSDSGLPRYEDRDRGLLWIDLPWKGVLMDSRSGQPLANDCKVQKG